MWADEIALDAVLKTLIVIVLIWFFTRRLKHHKILGFQFRRFITVSILVILIVVNLSFDKTSVIGWDFVVIVEVFLLLF